MFCQLGLVRVAGSALHTCDHCAYGPLELLVTVSVVITGSTLADLGLVVNTLGVVRSDPHGTCPRTSGNIGCIVMRQTTLYAMWTEFSTGDRVDHAM